MYVYTTPVIWIKNNFTEREPQERFIVKDAIFSLCQLRWDLSFVGFLSACCAQLIFFIKEMFLKTCKIKKLWHMKHLVNPLQYKNSSTLTLQSKNVNRKQQR